jgi:diguanylate cyclase (GGDEF)-like protein/PAS domain S-box-containing protein
VPLLPSETSPYQDDDVGVLLLVEDNPDHAFLVRRRLREQLVPALTVEQLGTAAAAVERVLQGDVRCVVLDLSLPDAKGLEAVRLLRTADPTVPIVVLTGMDNDEVGREALRMGAQDYLVKGQHGPDAVGRSVVFLLADRLRLVLESSAEGICMLDQNGGITFVNRAGADLLGAAADALNGLRLHEFHQCASTACPLEQRLTTPGRSDTGDAGEQLFLSRDGSTRILEVRARRLLDLSPTGGLVVNLTDVTARRAAQEALAEREAQLVDAQRLAHLGSWEWELATDEVSWSAEMYDITGLSPENVAGRAFEAYAALVPQSERTQVQEMFTGWTSDRPPAVIGHQLHRPDGSARWVQCRASIAPEGRVVGTVQDTTEQKVAEDALAHQALHDQLTGLPNRALLLDRLDRALADPRRALPVAVVYMDLDRFKWVNDSLSHSAGDELLQAVARRLSTALRPSDTLARFGGDEFVLVCEGLHSEQQVLDLVRRLATEFESPFLLEGREVLVTSSMGLAMAAVGVATDSESLLRDADTAMYWAKDQGRSRCEIFDEAMRQRASERLEVEHDLRQSLQVGDVIPWYQPVVDLRTGEVLGCEALARWNHPTRGLLTPEAFIPHAEETGLIVALGESILRVSCSQVAAWNRQRPADAQITLAVNVSARQLGSVQLVEIVSDALRTSGLAAERLCLEVTESVVMEDVITSGVVLNQLRDIGVRTAVDDFGTGYSSLAYLLSLPVDVLKIDRSFVQALDVEDGPAVAIVRAVAALASALGLGVLAEGVETQQQLDLLEALGVQRGQGFLWGRPVPAQDATWAVPSAAAPNLPRARPATDHQTPADAGRNR